MDTATPEAVLPASLRILSREAFDRVLDSLETVSDYYFATNEPIRANVQNRNRTVLPRLLDETELRQIVYILGDEASGLYDTIMSDPHPRDRSYTTWTTKTRYRVLIVRTAGHRQSRIRIVMRRLEKEPWELSKLRLPEGLLDATMNDKPGLVMVLGATGSGKTSLLSGLLRAIVSNPDGDSHLVTIEDPVEYLFNDVATERAVVSPIEIGEGCRTFEDGLRASLRMHPTHILVGEIRDAETAATCIAAARSGHKVFATMHTSSISEMFSRWSDFFPESAKRRAISDLTTVVDYAVYQTLERNEKAFGPVQESLDFSLFDRNKLVGHLEKNVHDIFNTVHDLVAEAGILHEEDWAILNPIKAEQQRLASQESLSVETEAVAQ
ncbi:ATPase, T2SS/T4P/T4SS family [Vreelandella rituensis]|uniref:Bacterial type II secretion system protein E domain-containing protein n=1 Tax=Vreelandella rituensis TaxID=2282306 RepID=A0A368UAZ1_9GAMM|nr:ATPase, T2SS/T4P/T4SS family [Halomonas rituensis]RCV93836.1 hypothetical protein DU506_01375 [Halomonas rituensis]